MAKMKGLMRETIEEEMVDPVLFDVRDGGTQPQVGYMSNQTDNKFVQDRMESGIFHGIKTAGIVFNKSMTGWRYAVDVCEHCKQATCEWEEKKEEMVAYNQTICDGTPNKTRRHTLYRQMSITINGGQPLGRALLLGSENCAQPKTGFMSAIKTRRTQRNKVVSFLDGVTVGKEHGDSIE
jgi:hypothetical protein